MGEQRLKKQRQQEIAKNSGINGIFQKLFGDALEDTCESNYDCQRPEVCCDIMVKVSSYPSPLVPLQIPQFHPMIHETTTKRASIVNFFLLANRELFTLGFNLHYDLHLFPYP